jgi:hypothetical protein
MARNVDDDGKAKIARTPDKQTLEKLFEAGEVTDHRAAVERGKFGELVENACSTKNLHKQAFGMARRLKKLGLKDPVKLGELVFHLKDYFEKLGIEKLCATEMIDDARAKAKKNADAVFGGGGKKGGKGAKAKPASNVVPLNAKRKKPGATGADIEKAEKAAAPVNSTRVLGAGDAPSTAPADTTQH